MDLLIIKTIIHGPVKDDCMSVRSHFGSGLRRRLCSDISHSSFCSNIGELLRTGHEGEAKSEHEVCEVICML